MDFHSIFEFLLGQSFHPCSPLQNEAKYLYVRGSCKQVLGHLSSHDSFGPMQLVFHVLRMSKTESLFLIKKRVVDSCLNYELVPCRI